MKKIIIFLILTFIFISPTFSAKDKFSEEYLKGSYHPFSMSFVGEKVVNSAIKQALKKEAPGHYKVQFKGYTLASIKKGIFKYLEITGKDVKTDDIEIPYFNIKTITDYNWVDYNTNPITFKSDITGDCIVHLSEKSVNDALEKEEYLNVLRYVNKKAYPLFTLNGVKVKIKNSKMYVIMSYNSPIAPKAKDRTFMVSSGVHIVNNEIMPDNVSFDSAYGNLPIQKVINLVNMINPLNFTAKLVKGKQSDVKIEKIKIEDDIVIINGKIYIKGEK